MCTNIYIFRIQIEEHTVQFYPMIYSPENKELQNPMYNR